MTEVCPFRPNPGQDSTKIQELQHRGAVDLSGSRLLATGVIDRYRPLFAQALNVEIGTPRSEQEAFRIATAENNVRRTLIRPFMYQAVPFIQRLLTEPRIAEEFEAGTEGYSEILSSGHSPHDKFVAQDRTFTDPAQVMLSEAGDLALRAIAKHTIDSIDEADRRGLASAFKTQTQRTKAAVKDYLDMKYPLWRSLEDQVVTKPDEHKWLPWQLRFWMGKLNMKEDIEESFIGAMRATSAFITDRLTDLHTACYIAGMPEEQWWPFAYSHVKQLAIESQLSAGDSEKLKAPDHENPYVVVHEPDDLWNVYFSEDYKHMNKEYLKKTHLFKGCQGAAEVFSAEDTDRQLAERLHQTVKKKSDGSKLDVDFTRASAAHLLTLFMVNLGEKLHVKLVDQSEPPPFTVTLTQGPKGDNDFASTNVVISGQTKFLISSVQIPDMLELATGIRREPVYETMIFRYLKPHETEDGEVGIKDEFVYSRLTRDEVPTFHQRAIRKAIEDLAA